MNNIIRKPPKRIGTPLETDLEQWAREQIALAGGLMLKWASPGYRGVPDNIILWPPQLKWGAYNPIIFAEFKIRDEQPDALQLNVHALLRRYGHEVWIPRTRKDVEQHIAKWRP